MSLRELNFSDELFYWHRTGIQATVIEVKCTLSQKVNVRALKHGLKEALRTHTNFRARPVIVRGRVKAVVKDVNDPPVFPEDGCPRHFGTAQTRGLMLYAAYREREITLHIFHGLADMRGNYGFLKTLMKFYCHEAGLSEPGLPAPDSADTAPVFEEILQENPGEKTIGRFDVKKHDIFHIPEVRFSKRTTLQRRFEIDVPLPPLLTLSKASESSVVLTIQAVVGHAIRKTYDVGERDIVCYTPIDLRVVFHHETGGNSFSSFANVYPAKLDKYDLTERAMLLRSAMDLQIQPENLYEGVVQTRKFLEPYFKMPLPVEIAARFSVSAGRKADNAKYTYGISYPGNISFSGQIDPFVESVCASAGSYSYPLWIVACEYKGVIRMMITQSFESDVLVKAIYKEFADSIPETAFRDHGKHHFDEFHLKDLRHLIEYFAKKFH